MMKELLFSIFLFLMPAGSLGLSEKKTLPQVDSIVVLKSERTMKLYSKGRLVREYKVALGGNPVGSKRQQGDHKTPEGSYVISGRNERSQFHLSLRVSYPDVRDVQWARAHHVDPGGDIMIHGLAPSFADLGDRHRQTDWTDGCIAVTNPEIEEIWKMVAVGTKIEIRP